MARKNSKSKIVYPKGAGKLLTGKYADVFMVISEPFLILFIVFCWFSSASKATFFPLFFFWMIAILRNDIRFRAPSRNLVALSDDGINIKPGASWVRKTIAWQDITVLTAYEGSVSETHSSRRRALPIPIVLVIETAQQERYLVTCFIPNWEQFQTDIHKFRKDLNLVSGENRRVA